MNIMGLYFTHLNKANEQNMKLDRETTSTCRPLRGKASSKI